MARVNTSPTKAKELPPLDPGRYSVECERAELGQSAKGNQTLKLSLVVLDGPEQGDGTNPTGRGLATTLYVADDSRSLLNALQAFGVEYDESGWDSDDFVKKEAVASVVVKMYEGDPVNNIRKFFPVEENA